MVTSALVASQARPRPRALLVMPEHWSCVLLRATIIERGWDAACLRTLSGALFTARPTPRVILLDVDALRPGDAALLAALDGLAVRPRLVVLALAKKEPPPGPWEKVLRRPLPLDALADAILAVRDAKVTYAPGRFDVGLDPPWPRIRCGRCTMTRHFPVPRSDEEEDAVRSDMLRFVVEHVHR
jgi:hypothetical protein